LDRLAREERRSRSQAIELAIENYLGKESSLADIPVSKARFSGSVSREETYGER
jgi:metal-responsive CopG/Arc/MetJ family transcriptional regulator